MLKANTLDQGNLRRYAMDLLARREYSVLTLRQKLSLKSDNNLDIDSVLVKLQDLNFLCDERFAQVFFNSRILRRLGPIRIKQELKQKGIDQDIIEDVFANDETDWFELAKASAENKISLLNVREYKDKQKLYRFLAYRGFSQDQISYVIEMSIKADI